jgi:hypothetical protein
LRGCSVGITDGGGFMKYAVEIASGGMKYSIKFHGDLFRHSSIIKIITSIILESGILVLLIWGGGGYGVPY